MNVLVAGGAGFIGSHLCHALINRGDVVLCVDNLITGDKANIKDLENNSRFQFLEHDVIKPLEIKEKIEAIYHFASPASPVDYQKYPLDTLLVNSQGTLNLLSLARDRQTKFLLASTSEIYGDPQVHPQTENYWGNVNTVGPRSCYDEAKRFAESLSYTFCHTYGVDARIIRIFNTYGPNMQKDDGRVISNFINQAIKNEPLTIYGNGSQTRSFCYVSDLVEGIIKVMDGKNLQGEVINLGNPDEHQIIEIAKIIKEMTGSKSEIVKKPLPKDDPCRRKPDISKARKLLNWEPKVPLKEGLQKTIAYFKSIL